MLADRALRPDESVELCHAWLQFIAADRGIRVLLIKGPALHRLGLRERTSSADVDVLVEPERFDEFCAAVADGGWRERDKIFISSLHDEHARTFFHEQWASDIDVHRRFPGFLASPGVVFDELWKARTTLPFGHRDCTVPGRAASLIVLALNELRTAPERPGRQDLARLPSREFSDAERAQIAALAVSTGSAATLAPVLTALGVHVEPSLAELQSPDLAVWHRWVLPGQTSTYLWLRALRSASWRMRAIILWRAVWPTRHDLLTARPDTRDSIAGRLVGRAQRVARGLRLLGRAAGDARAGSRSRPGTEN